MEGGLCFHRSHPRASLLILTSCVLRSQELYDLINRDYADFILVSTKLSGVGGKVADLRDPMAR